MVSILLKLICGPVEALCKSMTGPVDGAEKLEAPSPPIKMPAVPLAVLIAEDADEYGEETSKFRAETWFYL